MLSGIQPKFGAIILNHVDGSHHPQAKTSPGFNVTLTDGDRRLKPQIDQGELPDTFSVHLDISHSPNPEKANINYRPEPQGQGRPARVAKEQLRPLIEAITERGTVNEELAETLAGNHGLKAREDNAKATEYKQFYKGWAHNVAQEMARYTNVTYPDYVKQGLLPQSFEAIIPTFNALRKWVGLGSYPIPVTSMRPKPTAAPQEE